MRWLILAIVVAAGAYYADVGGLRGKLSPLVAATQSPAPSVSVVRWRDANGHWVYGDAAQAPSGTHVEPVKFAPLNTMPAEPHTASTATAPTQSQQPRNLALERIDKAINR
ncbi:hypothetical protein ABWL39_12445 [Chitinivorax sp. PXF-14]|uniref:hypothetical protein n=1 Tax=Pseudomonadota TaxID=1224 RepID=UPI003467D7AD